MPPDQGGVQFQADDANEFGRPPSASGGFDITGKLVEWGLVSSRDEAQYVLIGIGVVVLLVAVFIFWKSGGSGELQPPRYSSVQTLC